MFDRELKRTLAGSMERIDGSMERIDVHMERGNQLMDEVHEEIRLSREQHADLRQFIREMTVRMHKTGEAQAKAIEAQAKAIDANTAVLVDIREDILAVRKGMFQVLDRLSPPPDPNAN